jgi:DNA-binding IclR family transcriptional regulator
MRLRDRRRQAPSDPTAKIEGVAMASAIIDFLAESELPVGVQQVANVLGITKSRASRHLANLQTLGVVSRNPAGRGYRLGWRVIRWGQIAASQQDLIGLLDSSLQRLNRDMGQTILLCGPAGGDAVVMKCFPAQSAIRIEVKVGLVLNIPHSPSARIVFAFQSKEKREHLLTTLRRREEEFRVKDERTFEQQIAAIQRNFYCWTRDKFDLGHGAIAAPVFDQNEGLAAVITIVAPSLEFSGREPPIRMVRSLLECCEECSRRLHSRVRFPRPSQRRVKPARMPGAN